ncbi:hypothetical protein PAHAL_3G512200 [Panicum hallii]|uniref:Uncharacterized protein n=1 Tax=Panicum hallii TaxID=206008 RepID=A0A2T8KM67_9POAL|nr:hypothetical protein PAHAL_3G512200 [Panicum hallii]
MVKESFRALSDFVGEAASILTKKVQIYGIQGDYVIILSDLGRELYLGYLQSVIEKHRNGKSWNGVLSIGDVQVTDRRTFEIAKEASESATRQAMTNDFKKLSELLATYFQTTKNHIPIYFTELESDMFSCFQKLGTYNSHRTLSFQEYILSHLALKSAMARAHLFLDLYGAHQLLGREDHLKLRQILNPSHSETEDWTLLVHMHPVLDKVFNRGISDPPISDPRGSEPARRKVAETTFLLMGED